MTFIPHASRASAPRALLLLAFLLALLPLAFRPSHYGDANEYILTTLAFANHGTPDLRLSDLDMAKTIAPEMGPPYALLEAGMRDSTTPLYAAYVRGLDGKVYSVHFFAYPLLAAIPFKLLQWTGLPPLKCYQVVNLFFVFALGAALFRVFGTVPRMLAGIGLFFLCGGALYWNWSSPECMTAAALLAALLFFTSGAVLRGAVLAGLATLQNPTTVFFFGFAPLLLLCLAYEPRTGWRDAFGRVLRPRVIGALGIGLAIFALAPLFNLATYGVPNIIAKNFTTPALIGTTRLHSFLFDLNQGMIVGVPALLAGLVICLWRPGRARHAALFALATLFVLCLAIPALSINNWNSGATGVMRYGFWSAMPFLFVLLCRLRERAEWPWRAVGVLTCAQALAMVHALSFPYLNFSPLQRLVFAHAPTLSHPEPEIFAERAEHNDDYIYTSKVYQYAEAGVVLKTLYNVENGDVHAKLCGAGAKLSPFNRTADTYRGWRYIDGPVQCESADLNALLLETTATAHESLRLLSGWGKPEMGGGNWTGAWSDGRTSMLAIELAAGHRPAKMTLAGQYFDGNRRTRVRINGVDLGWVDLASAQPLSLAAVPISGKLDIALEHEAPRQANDVDRRALAFFLRKVVLQ